MLWGLLFVLCARVFLDPFRLIVLFACPLAAILLYILCLLAFAVYLVLRSLVLKLVRCLRKRPDEQRSFVSWLQIDQCGRWGA